MTDPIAASASPGIVERLRHPGGTETWRQIMDEAADLIARLTAPTEGEETTASAVERLHWDQYLPDIMGHREKLRDVGIVRDALAREKAARLAAEQARREYADLLDIGELYINELRATDDAIREQKAARQAAEEREAIWAKGRRPFENGNAIIAAQVKTIDDLNEALRVEKIARQEAEQGDWMQRASDAEEQARRYGLEAEMLQATVGRLEAALRPFANTANAYDETLDPDDRPVGPFQLGDCRAARAALSPEPTDDAKRNA